MAKKIKDPYESNRLKLAKKMLKSKTTKVETLSGNGMLHSIEQYDDNEGDTMYKCQITYNGVVIGGKAKVKLDSIVEALKHMELQGTVIRNYMI
jgi:hypothetical protein